MRKVALIAVLMVATIPVAGLAQEEKAAAPSPSQAPTPEPEPSSWTSSHSITVGAETVAYDAEVGSIILRDDKEKATAELFYTAYFRTNGSDAANRPLIFAYNGGPGSASFWLHMGIMGPRRVITPIVGQQAPPPYPMEDNQYTLLTRPTS